MSEGRAKVGAEVATMREEYSRYSGLELQKLRRRMKPVLLKAFHSGVVLLGRTHRRLRESC